MKDALLLLAAGLGGYLIYTKFFQHPAAVPVSAPVTAGPGGPVPVNTPVGSTTVASSPVPVASPVAPSWGNGGSLSQLLQNLGPSGCPVGYFSRPSPGGGPGQCYSVANPSISFDYGGQPGAPVIGGGSIQPIWNRFSCPEGQYLGSGFTGGQVCMPIGAVS